MIRHLAPAVLVAVVFSSCSSVGIHTVRTSGSRTTQAPTRIKVEPFSAPPSAFKLGERPASEQVTLRREIVTNLARLTALNLRTHAAKAAVTTRPAGNLSPGMWVVRGDILYVNQGSRALRAFVGLGAGRTAMRTRVSVLRVTPSGLAPLLAFETTGSSGLEPGAALAVATGGVGTAAAAANVVGSTLLAGLPGVSSDIDRTAYEITAVISAYLQANGLLAPSRVAIQPNMKGRLPTTLNLNRAVPAPLRNRE